MSNRLRGKRGFFMNGRFFGAVFLILGTCIGGSMLALPMATASEGILRTVMIMLGAWALMTMGAFTLLKVNLRLPEDSNLISMAHATIGKVGASLTWIVTLALLYTLLSAYISSGEDLLATIFESFNIHSPMWLNAILFTGLLGLVVFRGIGMVDYVNRGLMSTKLLVCLILLLLLIPFTHMKNLSFQHLGTNNSMMTCVTAFGYASIIPPIRNYLHSDKKKLYWAILLGGLIPLVCYIAWIVVVQATIPTVPGLSGLYSAAHPLKGMVDTLIHKVDKTSISILTNVFTSICVLTSFLGVALSLADFLADGLKLKKAKAGRTINAGLTLLPPLVIVLVYPAIFLKALNYAGILCVLLLLILPLIMGAAQLLQKYRRTLSFAKE
jgi:tyrosine-specific transport protein